jgi:hypothetical protein
MFISMKKFFFKFFGTKIAKKKKNFAEKIAGGKNTFKFLRRLFLTLLIRELYIFLQLPN